MQPQQPGSQPQYDFILNKPSEQQPSRFGPFSNMSKPMLILAVLAAAFLVVIVIVFVANKGGSSGSQEIIQATAKAQEIVRVSKLVADMPASDDTEALAATTQTTLTSEINQFTAYLAGYKVKISPKVLAEDQDSDTDTQMKTALQNNNLDQVYASYLNNQMLSYETLLRAAFQKSGNNGKQILSDAFNSVQVLLTAPQFSKS